MAVKNVGSEIVVGANQRERLERLVRQAIEWQGTIASLQSELDSASKDLAKVLDDQLPELMAELAIDEFKMQDGTKVKLVERFTASVSKRNEVQAAAIFKRLKAGDLVQYAMTMTFGASGDNRKTIQEIKAWSVKAKVPLDTKTVVNTATLKAWVRDQLHAGKLQPGELDALGVHVHNTVDVKQPKEKCDGE